MKYSIRVEFNEQTNQIMVYAPMSNQAEKDMTTQILSEAIKCVIRQPLSILIKPNGVPTPPTTPTPPQTH